MTNEYSIRDIGTSGTDLRPEHLAALISSRLCHDIVSPLGAIGNGLELLQMAPEFPGISASPEVQLIAESVEAARTRIKWFRLAFGHAPTDQRLGCSEIAGILQGLGRAGRISARIEAEGDMTRHDARLILLALMCLDTALPWGGSILICRGPAGWRLIAEGDRLKHDPDLWSWLDGADRAGGPRPDPKPAGVHFALLGSHALAEGRRLHWEMDEKGAEIAF